MRRVNPVQGRLRGREGIHDAGRAFPSACSPRTRPIAPLDATRTPRGADKNIRAQCGHVLEGDRGPRAAGPTAWQGQKVSVRTPQDVRGFTHHHLSSRQRYRLFRAVSRQWYRARRMNGRRVGDTRYKFPASAFVAHLDAYTRHPISILLLGRQASPLTFIFI